MVNHRTIELIFQQKRGQESALPPAEGAVDQLRQLLSEGLDLCARARKLDETVDKAMAASRQSRCATPAMWVLQQYDRDLADWEARSRQLLNQTGVFR